MRVRPAAETKGLGGKSRRERTEETDAPQTRAYVLCPVWRGQQDSQTAHSRSDAPATLPRSAEARCAEAAGLAEAIDLEVVGSAIVTLQKPKPATLFGAGKVEDIKVLAATESIGLIIIDAAVTPVQQRNLEKAWDCKVLDRTGLILEIFGRRARTKEGRLQVELAHLNYQKGRLVRSWTHLERQRGGVGFMGGPGETQIEADRRQIQDRIRAIETQLEKVRKTRQLHRTSRQRVPFPVIALVGYTNAGKSTLFNRLTDAEVFAEDLLFATLDPTLRAIELPNGQTAILSDTVGFISNLPTDLIAAFRATLEEVVEADLILHVRDMAADDSEAEAEDVKSVLEALKVDLEAGRVLEVWNKIDLLDETRREAVINQAARDDKAIAVSAITGQGVDTLLAALANALDRDSAGFTVTMGPEQGREVNWLYENCAVRARDESADGQVHLDVVVPPEKRREFDRRFPGAKPASHIVSTSAA